MDRMKEAKADKALVKDAMRLQKRPMEVRPILIISPVIRKYLALNFFTIIFNKQTFVCLSNIILPFLSPILMMVQREAGGLMTGGALQQGRALLQGQ